MLHLEGPNNTIYSGSGWRRWMHTGIFIKENSDAMYIGMKSEPGYNRSDAVINWSDDASVSDSVDKLRFIFTNVAPNGHGLNTIPIDDRSRDGYEFMRMTSMPLISIVLIDP